MKQQAPPHSKSKQSRTKPPLRIKELKSLLAEAQLSIEKAKVDLRRAGDVARRAGLNVESTLGTANISSRLNNNNHSEATAASATASSSNSVGAATESTTTGGHSNTDHVVVRTGNIRFDTIAEWKRNFLRRQKSQKPEDRGEERWDKPRLPGSRRRRIVRQADLPDAPQEPPASGYIVFLGQMTTKIRHDRPDQPHNQSKGKYGMACMVLYCMVSYYGCLKILYHVQSLSSYISHHHIIFMLVMQEISKIWRTGMSDDDRQYYNDFSIQARKEYSTRLQIEYRATGSFTPSDQFDILPGTNVWIRKNRLEQNGLEREISSYPTVVFPPRPPALEPEYEIRQSISRIRRKLKDRGLLNHKTGKLVPSADMEQVKTIIGKESGVDNDEAKVQQILAKFHNNSNNQDQRKPKAK